MHLAQVKQKNVVQKAIMFYNILTWSLLLTEKYASKFIINKLPLSNSEIYRRKKRSFELCVAWQRGKMKLDRYSISGIRCKASYKQNGKMWIMTFFSRKRHKQKCVSIEYAEYVYRCKDFSMVTAYAHKTTALSANNAEFRFMDTHRMVSMLVSSYLFYSTLHRYTPRITVLNI